MTSNDLTGNTVLLPIRTGIHEQCMFVDANSQRCEHTATCVGSFNYRTPDETVTTCCDEHRNALLELLRDDTFDA